MEAGNNSSNNGKVYNSGKLENRPETDLWTDDVAIDVWNDTDSFIGSKNPMYPSMGMDGAGNLYAAFSNYSESKVYYSKLGGSNAATSVFHAYDPPEEAAINVTTDGIVNVLYSANYHGGQTVHWNRNVTDAGGLYCYDESALPLTVQTSQGLGYPAKQARIHRFELFYHNRQLQQFKNFRITRGKNNRIHIAYYDTLSNSIKYATVMNNAMTSVIYENPWVNLDGGSDSDDTASYPGGTSSVLPETNFEGLTRTGGTAEYCAIALDASNRPVVVYADVDTGTLRLARADSDEPKAASNWKVQKVLSDNDENAGLASDYFTAKFDSSGYLHIAFRNTRGQLCYVKSTNANAGASAYKFGKSVVVDDSGLWADLTLNGTTPYIAYMSRANAYDGIRIAYFDGELVKSWNADGTENEKGGWNKITVALSHRANNARTCIAVAPKTGLGWEAAVGYTPGNIYRVVKYVGK